MFDITQETGMQTLADGRKFSFDATKKIFKKEVQSGGGIAPDETSTVPAEKFWTGTKAEYDLIPTKVDSTIYFVKD